MNTATTIEESLITRKTRELCQAILDEPSIRTVRERIDRFMADEQTRVNFFSRSAIDALGLKG